MRNIAAYLPTPLTSNRHYLLHSIILEPTQLCDNNISYYILRLVAFRQLKSWKQGGGYLDLTHITTTTQ